jgi:hypothetical protein
MRFWLFNTAMLSGVVMNTPNTTTTKASASAEESAQDERVRNASAKAIGPIHLPSTKELNEQQQAKQPPYVTAEILYQAEKMRDTYKAQAERLAEALREALTVKRDLRCANGMFQSNVIRVALAQWEGAKQ